MFTTQMVSPLDLHLDEENPRFRINVEPTQEEIRHYMISHEKILVLANSIVNMNTMLPGERIIIFNDGSKNIVLEGNRRTCVYQMLLNRELIPASALNSFPEASQEFLSEIHLIPVDVVANREDAMAFLAARHIIGVEKWSSVSKWKISYEYLLNGYQIRDIAVKLVMSANTIRENICKYKILLRGINGATWTEEEKRRLSPLDLEPDKLVRIVRLSDTTRRLNLSINQDYELVSGSYSDEMITRFIVLLTKMAFITNEINTRTTINDIWDRVIAEIPELDLQQEETPPPNPANGSTSGTGTTQGGGETEPPGSTGGGQTSGGQTGGGNPTGTQGTGGQGNLPYFFDGLQFGHLDRSNNLTHGVTRICMELKKFSERKSVRDYPLSAAFLTRSIIEHSLIYYAKTTNIQSSSNSIWSQISPDGNTPKLSSIISKYKNSLSNYIFDVNIRGYFMSLFSNYDDTANPLNWVIHRPDEYALPPERLLNLPAGLLALINYLLR